MTKSADLYFKEGCGRCALGGTPNCKVQSWLTELKLLRKIILEGGLKEESKWGVPTYTLEGKNILILAAFKEYCSVSFFKGALLNNASGLLVAPGESTQGVRLIRFVGVEEVKGAEAILRTYIEDAIALEMSGAMVELKKISEREVPEELQDYFNEMPELKVAFDALTPGRQRGYLIFVSAPKQSKTRAARIEKSIDKIMCGKGIDE